MGEERQVDLKELFTSDDLELTALLRASGAVYGSAERCNELARILSDWKRHGGNFSRKTTEAVKKGFAKWLLGKEEEALDILGKCKSSEEGVYLYGFCLQRMGRLDEALKVVSRAAEKSSSVSLSLLEAEFRIESADTAGAARILKRIARSAGKLAEYHYLKGFRAERDGQYEEACREYRDAIEIDGEHAKALFRLALNLDRRGSDAEAIKMYEKMKEYSPVFCNALMNLGLLYEDNEEYQKALDCFALVLKTHPDNERARLYHEDVRCSLSMVFHEDLEREQDRRNQILRTPVTDFELSVRSRNCLSKMDIRTLGDLIQKTEAELLSYKNFGETSLAEIKEMLTSRGLHLGMGRDEDDKKKQPEIVSETVEAGKEDIYGKPISILDLSMRSRKCMDQLGIVLVGDLTSKSEAELLGMKNFGQTSMNEVKRKLAELDLNLREP